MKSNGSATVICESNQQVKWLVNQPKFSDKISHWIAANPSAYWELMQQGVSFSSLEDFQINKTSEIIESLQAGQIRWAEKVDSFLQKNIPEFESTDFHPAQNYLIYLKNTWDTFIHRADLLENLEKFEHPDNVFFFTNPDLLAYDSNLLLQGSLFSECIPMWADYYGIKNTPFPSLSGDLFWEEQLDIQNNSLSILKSDPLSILKNNPLSTLKKSPQFIVSTVRKKFHSIFNNPWSDSFLHLPLPRGKKTKIFLRTQYDITRNISNQLRANGLNPVSFDDAFVKSQEYTGAVSSIDRPLKEAWQHITELEWFWQPGGWQPWSLRKGLEPLFQHFWDRIIPALWKSMNGSRILIKNYYPQAVCVSLISGPDDTGLIMAARAEKIPVIMYQHGACMGDVENTIWDLTDSYYSDYLLVYGKGEEDYVRSRSAINGLNVTPLTVGSTRLDELARCCNGMGKRKRPSVVYVPGVFLNNYFRYDYQDFRHCRIFDVRRRIAEVFHDQPEVDFSYKAFFSTGHDPTLDMFKATCHKCKIIKTISLPELQRGADLLIHELPGTAMYEGLVTDKPMIVYVDRDVYRMPPKVKEMLGKRAVIAETNDDLIRAVKQFLQKGDFSPLVCPDREFVKTFCTHLDDGQSAARAAKEISTIVKCDANRYR